jgi:acetylornithine deacetylase
MNRDARLPVRPETLEMIERLVGFDTTSRESNLGLIEWVRDWLKRRGIESRLTYDATGAKANLFATLDTGPGPGIVLSGHTDVVPVDGQQWDTDPFTATLKDDRIYGRGACDMKSYIAAALAATPRFLGAELTGPVHFALSYDEEIGCVGVRGLLADLERSGIRPGGCIVGEPTGMHPVVANKGFRSFRCTVRGKEVHSALAPEGVNAIDYAARLIAHIRGIADRLRETGPHDPGFDVPFTTLHTGLVRGGTAGNIVPRECEFHFEIRCVPGTDPDRLEREIRAYAAEVLEPEMRRVDPAAGVAFFVKSDTPGLAAAEDEQITALAQSLAREQRTRKVAYAAEAGLFQRAGIPSVICGPGSIEQAHRPNEYVALEQVARCEAFIDRLVAALSR